MSEETAEYQVLLVLYQFQLQSPTSFIGRVYASKKNIRERVELPPDLIDCSLGYLRAEKYAKQSSKGNWAITEKGIKRIER